MEAEISEQEQRGGEPVESVDGYEESPAVAEAALDVEKDCLLQEIGGESELEAQPDAAEKDALWR